MMTLLLLLLHGIVLAALAGAFLIPSSRMFRSHESRLFGKSKMPSAADLADLDKMLTGEMAWEEAPYELPDFSSNKRPKIAASPPLPPQPTSSSVKAKQPVAKSSTTASVSKPLVNPNSDWRNSNGKAAAATSTVMASTRERERILRERERERERDAQIGSGEMYPSPDDFPSFDELDYSDFEDAMRELEGGGLNPMSGLGSKNTDAPEEHEGLSSGDILPEALWEKLVNVEGEVFKFSKLHKSVCDVVVLYVDPRRMNAEFELIGEEFMKVPCASLKVATAMVNLDDSNDHRKWLKKNTVRYTLLTDPSKKFVDALKCRAKKRIMAGLFLVDVASCSVLKCWYQNDWDAFTTKDLIVEEITSYRQNPKQYIQSQIGIR